MNWSNPFFVNSVCAKNLSACDTDIDNAVSIADPVCIWGAFTLCASCHFPIFPSSLRFFRDLNFCDGRVTMLVSVSTALVSSFVPSTQLRISHSIIGHKNCFTSLYFFSTHDFTILCNSHDFFLTTEGWANYLREHDKNWHICCCFSLTTEYWSKDWREHDNNWHRCFLLLCPSQCKV